MQDIGVTYQAVNVLDEVSHKGVREAVKQFSNWPTFPQLFVNGELVGGADIIGEMYESGRLQLNLLNLLENTAVAVDKVPSEQWQRGEVALIDDSARPTASLISRLLNQSFDLHALHIVDESTQHRGDAGARQMGLNQESHFKVEMVTSDFDGLSMLQRQQRVYSVLASVMPRIHALSLFTRTPAEVP